MSATRPIPLACPIHKVELTAELFCGVCASCFPSVNGIPILINEAESVFSISQYLRTGESYQGASSYGGVLDDQRGLRRFYRRVLRRLVESDPPTRDFDVRMAIREIQAANPNASILLVGAGEMDVPGNVTYTDVAFGRNVSCIADAHDLPFLSRTFDACIACAVLEHVVDPYRCVDEMMRVLRPKGFVYAETPFMQPVHMREHDFTRFSHLGHRRLFRRFDELRSGIVGGPWVSAAQMLRYGLLSFSDDPSKRRWLRLIGILMTYPFRIVDRVFAGRLSAYDSASGFYFFGTLRDEPIRDRDLLAGFRGGS